METQPTPRTSAPSRAERLGLEPGSLIASASSPAPHSPEVAHSIAISLKRIADAFQGDEHNSGILHAIFDIANGRQG